MLAVVQRVAHASVVVDGQTVGSVQRGLLVLLGVHKDDTPAAAEWMAGRLAGLRIFEDEAGKMNLSVAQVGGGILLVPNFTLCADTRKGHRPSFIDAMEPTRAKPMFESVATRIAAAALPVAAGVFGADMKVTLLNDGPVTVILDSSHRGAA